MSDNPLHRYVQQAPESPGVYQMFDHQGRVLYVGKAKNLKARLLEATLTKVMHDHSFDIFRGCSRV